MSFRSSHFTSARRRFLSLFAATSPLSYGLLAVIAFTVGYSILRVLPALRHDLQLLQEVYAVDERGIHLEGDLQYQIQESRRRFLRALLAAGKRVEEEEEAQSMRSADAAIARTE